MQDDSRQTEQCALVLSALAASERLRIVRLLAEGPKNVSEIADMLGVPPVNACHHLNILKNSKIITREKRGRFVFYSLCEGVHRKLGGAAQSKECLNLGCCQLVMPFENPEGEGAVTDSDVCAETKIS